MKYVLAALLLLLPLGLFAEPLSVGAPFALPSVQDQFEKPLVATPQTRQIIVAYTKKHGDVMKKFIEANPDYLRQNDALYLMDATAVPGPIMSLFMLPKFKKYTYSIGLIEDEKDVTYFPKKENHLTVITLENLNVTAVDFKEKF
ncbi:MAG: hypothetical protein IBX45_04800 [Campylobacterales bacterium]|nr:hypothetical protein [Campylobacterales bacterium]